LGADGVPGTADDGLRLGTGSPAINSGSNAYVPVGTTTDIGGATRISGTVDMGAYETLPVITNQPQSITVAQNAVANFSVTATGTGTLSYQWQKDGVNIPGATSSTYSLASAKPWHIGNYTAIVTDSTGSVISVAATLNITGINSSLWRGLIGYYELDGSSGDLSPFARSGVNNGATPTANRFGKSGLASYFNGSSFISVPSSPVTGKSPFTVSFWASVESQTTGSEGWQVAFGQPNGNQAFHIGNRGYGATNIYGGFWSNTTSSNTPLVNFNYSQFFHFVAVFDGVKVSVFKNGLFIGSSTNDLSGVNIQAGSINFGKQIGGFDEYFKGMLDSIRVYNRDLAATEISNLYAAENAPNNWRQTHFGSTANSGSASDSADPDGDGLKNLLEYALNLPPNAASRVPAAVQAAGGNLEYTYTRGTAAYNGGTTFQVEWSDDLTTWFTTGVVESLISDDGTHQQVKATLPAGSGDRRFVRLRVQ
jgi:hypothetical protein